MAKELPYFKFYPSEWNDGDITLEDYALQGLFINICGYYWSKDCDLTLANLNKKFRGNIDDIEALINSEIIKIEGDFISIYFLNEQWKSKELQVITNKINGQKGGRPPKLKAEPITEEKPNGLFFANQEDNPNESETKPSQNQYKEKERKEDKRKEKESGLGFVEKWSLPEENTFKNDLAAALMTEFGFNQIAHPDKLQWIWQFLTFVEKGKGLEYFQKTFIAYKKYKELSREIQFNFTGLLGSPAKQFEYSGWDSENWQHKIDNFKKNGTKQSDADARQRGRHEMAEQLRNMSKPNPG